MSLFIPRELMDEIRTHGERAYPEEGAGFLLGRDGAQRSVEYLLSLSNAREQAARHNRYLIGPKEYMAAELEAERRQLTIIGVFHSHPDHPDRPSDFDREWAQPLFSYVITSVESGRATATKSWRLSEDRSRFVEEDIRSTEPRSDL